MANKHLTEQEIAQAADALSQNNYKHLDAKLKAHLSSCDSCSDEVLMISTLVDDDAGTKHQPLTKRKYLKLAIAGLGAAACIALVIGTFVKSPNSEMEMPIAQVVPPVTMGSPHTISAIVDTNADKQVMSKENVVPQKAKQVSIKQARNDRQLLAYTPNEKLEQLVMRFQNSTVRSVISQEQLTSVIEGTTNAIILRWSNTEKEEFTVEIFDNTEKVIVETTLNGTSLKPELTTPGLYYWKMYNEDFDLLFCGKIIVNK